MKRKIIPILLILFIITICTILLINKDSKVIGEVETSVLPHTCEVSGKILKMPVALGQEVKKGDIVAVIDDSDEKYALTQLQISLEKAKLNLSDATINNNGNTSNHVESSISIASANYSSAKATAAKALRDYEQASTLYQEGAIPKNELENKKLASESASYASTVAKGQLDNAQNQISASSISLEINQLESKIQQAQSNLTKYTILASQDGTVMSKNYVEGDMVAPGYNLLEIAPKNERYLVFYIPKEDLYKVSYNEKLFFRYEKTRYSGLVKYIDVKSEYTPKDLQTEANKNRESVKIKILLPKENPMKPGETAEILFP